MSERTLLDWALLAARAASIQPGEVSVVENVLDATLPAFSIGNSPVYSERIPFPAGYVWIIGDEAYMTLAEALAEAVSQEVYHRVEEALAKAGLATANVAT